jgi:hypothetical protein
MIHTPIKPSESGSLTSTAVPVRQLPALSPSVVLFERSRQPGLINHRDGRVRLVYDALSPKDQEKWRIEWKRDAEAALG